MNIIAVDIGNTNTSMALIDSLTDSVLAVNKMVTPDFVENYSTHFSSMLDEKYEECIVVISSVVEFLGNNIVKEIECLKFVKSATMLSADRTIPITIEYHPKKSLGLDRVANALYAFYKFPKQNIIIVDTGTATTVDLLLENGVFKGGYIMPGLSLQLNALAEQTSQLPNIADKVGLKYSRVPNSTSDAIYSGSLLSVAGGIKLAVLKLSQNIPSIKVIVTGGNWKSINNDFSFEMTYVEHLTLLGISQFVK